MAGMNTRFHRTDKGSRFSRKLFREPLTLSIRWGLKRAYIPPFEDPDRSERDCTAD